MSLQISGKQHFCAKQQGLSPALRRGAAFLSLRRKALLMLVLITWISSDGVNFGACATPTREGSAPIDMNSDIRLIQPLESLPNPSGGCALRQLDFDSPHREGRFPSVEERVCLYMTRWYDPNYGTADQWKSVLGYDRVDNMTLHVTWNNKPLTTIQMTKNLLLNDLPFFVTKYEQSWLSNWSGQKHWIIFACYGYDTEQIMKRISNDTVHPVVFVWGDQEILMFENKAHLDVTVADRRNIPQVPMFAKWRHNNLDDHARGPVPIILKMDSFRHFGEFEKVKAVDTIPWSERKNIAVWRGAMTGILEDGSFYYDQDDFENNKLEVCMMYERCRFVYLNKNSTHLVDAGFVIAYNMSVVNGINLTSPRISMADHFQYKMIISIEGNDVATGLKWNLYSKSVVLMPPPKKSIYAMEYLLEPWVHYVPLDVDNIEKAITWVLEHEEEAQRIAQRATNFIDDMMIHPDAEAENAEIEQRIADRYTALWMTSEDADGEDKPPDEL